MKKNKLLLKGILVSIISLPGILSPVRQAFAQCLNAPYNQYPTNTFSPSACNGTAYAIAPDCWAGEYSLVAVSSGNRYTFSSSNTTDYTTISNEGGTTAYVFGVGPQVYTATFSGNVRFYTHTNAACGTEAVNRTRLVACQLPPVTVFYNNGATVFVGSGTIVQANGDIVNQPSSFTNTNGSFTNNGNLTVTGNIRSDDIFPNVGTGTLNLNGTAAQTISGNRTLRVYNLTMNNPAGVLLNDALRIEGAATFTNGVVDATNSNNPVIFSSNGSVSGTPANASHVNGYVMKEGTGSFDYPVGNATNYQKTTVDLTANSAGMMVRYYAADAGNAPFTTSGTEPMALSGYNTKEYWDISPAGTATGKVTIYWDGYNDAYSNSKSSRRVAHKINGGWQNEGTIGTGNESVGQVVSNTISTWSPFTFGSTSVILPLSWLSVTGNLNSQKQAVISWKVNEQNVAMYEVEKSSTGTGFVKTGSTPGKGDGINTYSFTEPASLTGTGFYRVKQTDKDGRTAYSAIVKLVTNNLATFSVFPNPATDKVTVTVGSSLLNTTARLLTLHGQVLQQLVISNSSFVIDVSKYASGMYVLKLSNGATETIIKQ